MRRIELLKQRHDLKIAFRRAKIAVDKKVPSNEDEYALGRPKDWVKAELRRNLKKSQLKKSLRRPDPEPCVHSGNQWYTFSNPNCSNLLDEVVVMGYSNVIQPQMNKNSALLGNPFLDAKSMNRGLLYGKGLNTTYSSILDNYMKEALKTKSFSEIASKQLKAVQYGSKALGTSLHILGTGVSYYQYKNDQIGLGKFSYRLAGTGSSIYVGAMFGGPYGLAVGLMYAGGESYYDAVKKDRAYNRAARKSDTYIDTDGDRKQNQQTLSSENMEYYLSGGLYNNNDF